MSDLVAFIKCLPILIGIFQSIKKAIEEAELDGKIQDHMQNVKKAFDEKDASHLNSLFNGVPDAAAKE